MAMRGNRGHGSGAHTRDFRETVRARVARDASFRRALVTEGVHELLGGNVRVGMSVLRDYFAGAIRRWGGALHGNG